MPSRGFTLLIVLLFLVMVTWQLTRAYLEPYSAAPKFKGALDEAVKDGETTWTLYHNGRRLGTNKSQVRVDPGSGYMLKQVLHLDGDLDHFLNLKVLKTLFQLNFDLEISLLLETNTRVTYLGSLISMDARTNIKLTKQSVGPEIMASFSALADEGFLRLSGHINLAGTKLRLPDDYRIRYDSKNLFFGSLNPADVMPGLLPGQQWEAPLIDLSALLSTPANMANSANLEVPERKPIRVRVKEELQALQWHGQTTPCFVVECKQRGLVINLWVRVSDGRVLKQAARWGESTYLEIVRDPPKPRPGVETS
jgi:hypothetical protein